MGRLLAETAPTGEGSKAQAPEADARTEVHDASPGSTSKPRIVAVIPAYNEEIAIGSVVLGARSYVDHVIVVDDCSHDRTSKIAQLAGAQVIRMLKNGGKAKALLTGLREAERLGCWAAVMLDGDGQHRTEDIEAVVGLVVNGEADLVIGSRFLGEQKDIPRYRVFGQKVINSLSNFSTQVEVTDSQSGLRALSRKALKNLNFTSEGYNVESDMITHFTEHGLVIKEVPISVRYDVPNGHKEGATSMGMKLLGNVVSMIGYKRPLLLFGVPGSLCVVAGLIIAFLTILEIVFTGTFITQAMLALGLFMIGSFFFISALTLNSLVLMMKANNK
ncbi:MAG: glycosyltransferase family 2 protein [Methanomassiliicoccus sp.]|nr:glycosyltransferase family 2 protein [Methanomassiliicoccus sp.]